MAVSTIATLNGFPLVSDATVSWRLVEGVQPNIQTFDLHPADADAIMASQGGTISAKGGGSSRAVPCVLKIESNGTKLEVKRLFALRVSPGADPSTKRVTVADRRWFWEYFHIKRAYNLRRRVGLRRVLSQDDPVLLSDVVPAIWYKRATLKVPAAGDAGRWTAFDILENVIAGAIEGEGSDDKPLFKGAKSTLDEFKIEDVTIDEIASAAVARALGYLPHIGLYVDRDGVVQLYDRTDASEGAIFNDLAPEIVGMGHAEATDNFATSPRACQVFITRELEVRFDFVEPDDNTPFSTTPGGGDDLRRMENVIQVPDFDMELSDGTTVPIGSHVTLDQALRSTTWNNFPGGGRLTHEFIRKAMAPHSDMWVQVMGLASRTSFNDWGPRVGAIHKHWRRTFRITTRWMDRIESLKAYRVGTVERVRGQRGAANAYCDHFIVANQRGVLKSASQVTDSAQIEHGRQVFGYPTGAPIGGVPSFNDATRAAPANVTIVDADQGIISVDFITDQYRMQDMVIPGKLKNIPKLDPSSKAGSIAWNAKPINGVEPIFESGFKIAIILTAVPLAQNDLRQFHNITVTPEQVTNMFPGTAADTIKGSKGPEQHIRIPAGLETARVAWFDARATEIEAAFGLHPGLDSATINTALGKITVNHAEDVNGNSGASLPRLARAAAARAWSGHLGHIEGRRSGFLNPSVEPRGMISEISHDLAPDGTASTTAMFPPHAKPLDIFNFLDPGTRAILARQAQP